MLAADIRTDFLEWLRFPLWSGFEVFIIKQEALAWTLLFRVLHNCQQSVGLTVMFTYSVALNPRRSHLSRAPCQLAKDSRSHVESLSLSKTQKHEGRLAETGSLVYNGQI